MSLLGSAASSVPPAPPSQVACAADAAARGRPGEEPAEPHCHLLSDGTLVCHSAAAAIVDGGGGCGSIGGIGGRPGLTTWRNCRFYIYIVLFGLFLTNCHIKSQRLANFVFKMFANQICPLIRIFARCASKC